MNDLTLIIPAKNESESLKRFNLISKTLKKKAKDSDESKIALALAAYESSMWGEAQKYLDSIPIVYQS